MKYYSHMLTLAFEVNSTDPAGKDITPAMIRAAIKQRIENDLELMIATMPPDDTLAVGE